MRTAAFIFCVFFAVHGFAQRLETPRLAGQTSISLNAFAQGSGKGISNGFLTDLITEDVLPGESIDRMLDLSTTDRRIGFDYSTSFAATWAIDENPWSISFLLSDHFHGSGELTNDMLSLGFKGNSTSLGEELDLGPSRAQWFQFQKIGLGGTHEALHSSISLSLSYVNVQRWGSLVLDQSSLYTSQLGDTLRYDLIGSFSMSDTSGGARRHRGGGAAVDLAYTRTFTLEDVTWRLSGVVRDLGMVQNHAGTGWDWDTLGDFTGILDVDLLALEDGSLADQLSDSADRSLRSFQNGGVRNSWLPGWGQISMEQEKDKGLLVGFGATWRWHANADPYAWVSVGHRFNERWMISGDLGYGGYGTIQSNLRAVMELTSIRAYLRLSNVEALLLSNSLAGAGVAVGIQYGIGK